MALAEHYPARDYQRKAADTLESIERAASLMIPQRIRFEIVNQQARAAVLLDDLEAFEFYINSGLDGAVLLGSKQREREARQAWQLAAQRWPSECRVKAVTERLQLTAGDSSEGQA